MGRAHFATCSQYTDERASVAALLRKIEPRSLAQAKFFCVDAPHRWQRAAAKLRTRTSFRT
jgi:hypothetical protein